MANPRGFDSGGQVLVTGACGFIGSHLVRHLVGQNLSVVALDDLSTGDRRALPVDDRVRLVVGSVTDPAVVRTASAGCDFVFHLAGLVGMDLVSALSERTYAVSVLGTEVLLRVTRRVPVVLLSSSCVSGLGDARVCREAEPVSRASVVGFDAGTPGYATGKWEMERMARRAVESGRDVLVVRPFNVVGPGQSMRHGMVLPRFVHAALRDETLTIYGSGEQSRAFSCVTTFAAALVRLIAVRAAWSECDHLVNLGAPATCSILELARIVLDETGSRSRIEHAPYTSRYPGRTDVVSRRPDLTRAERLLGPVIWPELRPVVRAVVRAAVADDRAAPERRAVAGGEAL